MTLLNQTVLAIDYIIEKSDNVISFKAEEIDWEFELEIMDESSNVAALECVQTLYDMVELYKTQKCGSKLL